MPHKYTFFPRNLPVAKPGSVLTRMFNEAMQLSGVVTPAQLKEKVKAYVDEQADISAPVAETAVQNIMRGLLDDNMSFSMFVKGMRILDQAFTIQLGNGNE